MLAVQCLLARLAFLPPHVRERAVQKLAIAGSPKAASALLRVLELQDQVVHQTALTGLGTVGPALLKPAMEHLRSGVPARQLAAAPAPPARCLVLVVPGEPLFVPPLAFGFGFALGTVITSPQPLHSNRFPAAAPLTRKDLEQEEQLTGIMDSTLKRQKRANDQNRAM